MTGADVDQLIRAATAVVAAAALALGAWALFRDRSRGRRRCPRCWYDLSGTTELTCSECGHTVRRERALRRTRRRWRFAFVAIALLLVAGGGAIAPAARRGEMPRLVPTTALILMMPDLAKQRGPLAGELIARWNGQRLWRWQQRLLIDRVVDDVTAPWSISLLTRDRWPRGGTAWMSARLQPTGEHAWLIEPEHLRLVVTPVGFDVEPAVVLAGDRLTWKERCRPIGAVAPGPVEVVFDVAVQFDLSRGGPFADWTTIETDRLVRIVAADEPLDALMRPVRSAAIEATLERELWVAVYPSSIRVVRTHRALPDLGDTGAMGLRFELRRDGETVAETAGWWGNNDARRRSEHLAWERGAFDAEAMRVDPSSRWTLAVRGDPRLALRAYDDRPMGAPPADRYWDGEVEIELRLARDRWYAIPTREQRARHAWAWNWDLSGSQRWR